MKVKPNGKSNFQPTLEEFQQVEGTNYNILGQWVTETSKFTSVGYTFAPIDIKLNGCYRGTISGSQCFFIVCGQLFQINKD